MTSSHWRAKSPQAPPSMKGPPNTQSAWPSSFIQKEKQDQFSLTARWRLYPVFSPLATSFLQSYPLSCCGLATHGFVWLLKLRPHLPVMAGKKDLMFWKSVVDLHSAWVEVLPLLNHMLGLMSFNPAGRLWICHISFWNGPNTEPCCTLYLQDWHQKICTKKKSNISASFYMDITVVQL